MAGEMIALVSFSVFTILATGIALFCSSNDRRVRPTGRFRH